MHRERNFACPLLLSEAGKHEAVAGNG